ncbi:MAG: aspartate aminotransferase family protein, partial [Endozoicomonas sp.]
QLKKLNFFSAATATPAAIEFSQRLLEKMPGMNKVYYSTSGSEANEKAYKIVRQIAHKKYKGKKNKILYRERDYHGTTITCLSSSGQPQRRDQYGPFTPHFIQFPHCCQYRCQYDDLDQYGIKAANEMEKVILKEGPENIGATIIEPITAGGGVIPPPEHYLVTLEKICRKYEILLIVDEVVCGLGRTGAWFGYQHYGIQPDIVTLAKGVTSGYAAISCTVTTEAVFEQFMSQPDDVNSYFRDISTFAGCTSGPAAALENMRILEEEQLINNAKLKGEYLISGLCSLQQKHSVIGDIRGLGLLIGIELVKNQATKIPLPEMEVIKIANDCFSNGLIIGRTNRSFPEHNNTLCLAPALTITQGEADKILSILDKTLTAYTRSHT